MTKNFLIVFFHLVLAISSFVAPLAVTARAECVTSNGVAEVAFGYPTKWALTHDPVRQAVVEICGLSHRQLFKGEITDAALDGVSLYVERCEESKLTEGDRAAIARFRSRGGKVMSQQASVWWGRSVDGMIGFLERNVPQLAAKCDSGRAFVRQVEDDNREARKEFKSVMFAGGPDEIRGISCHDAYGPRGKPYGNDPRWQNWDLNCARLKRWGFNLLAVNVCHAGCGYYNSAVVPVSAQVERKGDALNMLLAACRRHGLRFVAWRVCLRRSAGETSAAFDRWIEDGRGQRDIDGRPSVKLLCPNAPRNRKYEVDACVELARKGVDSVSLDYIRYTDDSFCFCDRCRELFAKRVGESRLAGWPKCVRTDKDLKEEWEKFRRETITSLVREVHDAVKAAVPTCAVAASVATPNWNGFVAQEWDVWCREGLVDCIGPMNYEAAKGAPAISEIGELIRLEARMAGKALMKPTLYPVCIVWEPGNVADLSRRTRYLIDSIREYRRLGVKAFGIFEFTNPFIDMIGMGEDSEGE